MPCALRLCRFIRLSDDKWHTSSGNSNTWNLHCARSHLRCVTPLPDPTQPTFSSLKRILRLVGVSQGGEHRPMCRKFSDLSKHFYPLILCFVFANPLSLEFIALCALIAVCFHPPSKFIRTDRQLINSISRRLPLPISDSINLDFSIIPFSTMFTPSAAYFWVAFSICKLFGREHLEKDLHCGKI